MTTLLKTTKRGMMSAEPVLSFDIKPSEELLTPLELADFLKISVTGVRRLQYKRAMPFHKVGGSIRFRKADIDMYLQKQRVESLGQ